MHRKLIMMIVPLFFIAFLSGCGAPAKYIEGQNKVDRILAERVKVTKLPISVKVRIDEQSKNMEVARGPRAGPGQARTAIIRIGQQMALSVNRVADMLFEDAKEKGDYDADFYVTIKKFDIAFEVVGFDFFQDIIHDMILIVDSKLQNRSGSVIYQKTSTLDKSGKVKFDLVAVLSSKEEEGGGLGKIIADAAALWEIDLMKDISQNNKVLEFAKAKTSTLSASAGPDIIIPGHLDGMSTNEEFVQFTGEIQATIPVKKITISVNGKPIEKLQGLNKLADTGTTIINQALPLSAGENVITITAIDKDGGTSQKVIKITREQKGIAGDTDLRSKIGDKYAVVVGISEYENKTKGIASITNAAEEANQFARFIKSPQGGNFKDSNVLLLTNEKATSSALRRALFTFLKKAIEEDLVFLFFSGQGAYETGNTDNYYLLTHDADLEDLPTSAIPVWDIENAFKRNIKARRAVLFMDAQHVAKLAKDDSTRSIAIKGNIVNKYLKVLAEAGEGKVIISAAQGDQVSSGGSDREKGARFFTQCLLKALKGDADKNGDGIVSLGEVIDYTTDCVDTASNGKQRPDVAGRYDRNLPLAVIK
jgi:hypothetical protein